MAEPERARHRSEHHPETEWRYVKFVREAHQLPAALVSIEMTTVFHISVPSVLIIPILLDIYSDSML